MNWSARAKTMLGFVLVSILGCGGAPGKAKDAPPLPPNAAPATAKDAPAPPPKAAPAAAKDAPAPPPKAAQATVKDAPPPQEEAPAWMECDPPVKTLELQSGDLGTVTVKTCSYFPNSRVLLRSAKHGAIGIETAESAEAEGAVRDWFSRDGKRMFIVSSSGTTLAIIRLAALFEALQAKSEAGDRMLSDDEVDTLAELSFLPVASLKPTFPEQVKRRKWNWKGWHGIIDPPDEDTEYPLGSSRVFALSWRSNNVLRGVVHFGDEGEGQPFCVKVRERLFKEVDKDCPADAP